MESPLWLALCMGLCRPCYDYERSEGTQCCPQCNTGYKRHKGCPRFAGDEEDNFDHDDFADEFQRKRHTADASHQSRYALNHWEIGNHDAQQLRPSGVVFSSAGSGNNCTSNMFGNDEWKERLQKWKVRQEKRSLISKDDLGGNKDNGEEDDFL